MFSVFIDLPAISLVMAFHLHISSLNFASSKSKKKFICRTFLYCMFNETGNGSSLRINCFIYCDSVFFCSEEKDFL
ncbi:hypothetical protein WUBG_00935, partial [Wuchereria bancrofti]